MDIAGVGMAINVATTQTTPAVTAAGAPDALATERFAAIMQADPAATGQAAQMVQSGQAALPAPQATGTMGERILNGLNNLSSDFQQSWKNVNDVLDGGGTLTTAEMLKLQMNLTQMSIQYDLVGKVLSRSTSNIEQLVKIS